MFLLCKANGASNTGFTDGKNYKVNEVKDGLFYIEDDNGKVAGVVPNTICPYLTITYSKYKQYPWRKETKAVGKFILNGQNKGVA